MDNEEKEFQEQSVLNVGNDSHIENILVGGKSARALGVIIIVLFVGIMLSFLVNFGVSAYLGTEDLSDSYFDGNEHQGIVFPRFTDTFYLSETIRQNIIRVDYYLFGRLHGDNVLLGDDLFLFPTYDEENDYNYAADYIGELVPGERELDAYYEGITALTDAYKELGAECYVVVIPNAQTVYPEKMPDFMGDISIATRLSAVSLHFADLGVENYIDLTKALLKAKQHGELYNNTEDSLNSRGAYYAYLELYKKLPEKATASAPYIKLKAGDLVRHTTVGKELAREVTLEEVIRNRTVSLSTDFAQKYQVLLRYESYDMAFPKAAYMEELPAFPRIEFCFASDWDRIIMIDYFSNTFGTTIYRSSLDFNAEVVKQTAPEYVILFLHEKDLGRLADGSMLPH